MSRQVFRIFVSSTFGDFQAEREALRAVWDRLEIWCAGHGASFQVVDLRWGIGPDLAFSHDTIQICLNEVKRCQKLSPKPNFLMLIGDRYGWRPPAVTIPDEEFTKIIGVVSTMPPTVKIAADVNMGEFAERYRFTGGLIRNTIFLALTATGSRGEHESPTLTAALLHFAAGKQTAILSDDRNICKISIPSEKLDLMPLESTQRSRLKNLATVWNRLKKRQTGLSIIITATDVVAAEQAARGIAHECGLVVRSFDFQQVISRAPDDRIIDPITQRLVSPIDYAFSHTAGDEAMTLFIDHDGILGDMLAIKKDKMADIFMMELLTRLRGHTGIFCIAGRYSGEQSLPSEFSVHEHLIYPEREQQAKRWREQLGYIESFEADLLGDIISDYPLHVSEIDFICRQAAIIATIRRLDERPTIPKDIRDQPWNASL